MEYRRAVELMPLKVSLLSKKYRRYHHSQIAAVNWIFLRRSCLSEHIILLPVFQPVFRYLCAQAGVVRQIQYDEWCT